MIDSGLMQQLKLDPADFSAVYPLTPMQRDMYLDSIVNMETLQSSQGMAIIFRHGIETLRVRGALQAMLDHHSILRARLIQAPEADPEIAYLGVSRRSLPQCDELAIAEPFSQAVYRAEASRFIYRPFALHTDNMLRCRIINFNDGSLVLLIAMHHIISDGGSLNLFRQQFLNACTNYPAPETAELGQDNYFSFAQENIRQADSPEVTAFWQEQLAHTEALVFHPTEKDVKPADIFPFQWLEKSFDTEHSNKIKAFCRKKGITPAIYFKLLYTLVLHHYCRPDADFYIQEAYSIRPQPSHTYSQGCYLQQLPFLVKQAILQSPAASIDDLIEHAKCFQHATKNYRAISLKLINQISPRGRIAFMYNFYHFIKPAHYGQESFDDEDFSTAPEKSVHYIVKKTENNFVQRLIYDYGTFSDLNFLDRVEALSRQFVFDDISNLAQLRFVTQQQELDTLLSDWNNTARPFDLSQPLHAHFEMQVAQQPEKIAVIYQKQSLSYQALNAKANQLAHALLNWGIKSGELVALFCERHPDFLVGALAILKAGAAYVPIDTGYPNERIEYMLTNSAARILITRSSQIPRITGRNERKSFCLDSEWNEIAHFGTDAPACSVSGQQRAYMIYTSGSTGAPKGAIIRHNGALNHIFAEQQELNIQQFNFLQTAPTSSDISVWQFLAPLVTGGTCVILEDVTDIPALIKHIDQHQINIVELVPVVLTLLLDYVSSQAADRSFLPSLKAMMATGEAVPVPLINRWLKFFPAIPITNAYGPTEAADDVIQVSLHKSLPVERLSAPIGRPLANFNIFILDPYLRLVPAGVVGEICIAGIGVGEGYWNNPEQTAKSFISNPFGSIYPTLYKTGDLGRWTPEGLIEYLDRVDNQIKIRGHRIELGEIEAQLAKHPQVRECAVTVREDLPGDKYISAYLIANDKSVRSGDFKGFLKQRLPVYMLPRHITLLDAFPTTPAGKIDRKNLPRPSQSDAENALHSAPTNKVELKLATIWQKALKCNTVYLEDNFFDLGGHSVLAIKVLQEIEHGFGVAVTPTEFMQAENFSVLAQLIQSNVQQRTGLNWIRKSSLPPFSVIVPLKTSGRLPPLFCVHGAGGNIFGFHQIAQCINPDQPFYGIQAQGIDGLRVPHTTVPGMAATYVREIQKIQPHGPYYVAGYSAGSVIALEIAQQLTRSGQQVAAMISIDLELERIAAEQPIEKIRNRLEQLRSKGLDFVTEWATTRLSWELWRSRTRVMEWARDLFGIAIPLKLRDRYLYEKVAAACKEYKVSAYPGVITLLRARDQDRKTLLPGGGWEKISLQPVEVLETPGDHHTIFTKPLLPKLAAVLDEALENARARMN